MAEEVLDSDATEEPALDGEVVGDERPLPQKARTGAIEASRGEMKTAAMAAAGGIVAGVATVAVAKAARGVSTRRAVSKAMRRRRKVRPADIVASRSFLIDVHVLDR
jgi:hypothetical protein